MQVTISKDLIDSIYNFFNEKPFEKEFRSDSEINYKNLSSIKSILDSASQSKPILDEMKNEVNNNLNLNLINNIFDLYFDFFQDENYINNISIFLNKINLIIKSNFEINFSKKDIYNFLNEFLKDFEVNNEISLYTYLSSYIDKNILDCFEDVIIFVNDKINKFFKSHINNECLNLDLSIFDTIKMHILPIIMDLQLKSNLVSMKNNSGIYTNEFPTLLGEISSHKASKSALKKAEFYRPMFLKMEKIWDEENWTQRGRGKYEGFAKHVIKYEKDYKVYLAYETIKKYISKYDKK